MAMNMPIQGAQADIVKQAMLNLEHEIVERGLAATMILQVHDELVLEVSEDGLESAAKVVKNTMETAFTLTVPTIVELRTGPNWDNMQDYAIS
jgi:DNA polymerase-1